MLPFLFTTLKRHLGTEDTKWWSVSGVILSHSSWKQVLRGQQYRVFVVAFCASKCATHSLLETGRTAGRPVKYPYPLPPQPGLCNVCRMWFALSCWNMHGRPWKRCLLEGSILCSKISMYFSALMVPSQKCKLPLPRALTQPHTMTDPGFWTCCWVTVWMILFFFGPEHTASIPPKKYLKYWFIWPQYTFPLCDGPSQMPPSPEKSTALLDIVNIGLPFGTVQF